jgi:hypothetical protein
MLSSQTLPVAYREFNPLNSGGRGALPPVLRGYASIVRNRTVAGRGDASC